jgi:GxxExxY protein
MRPTLGIIVYYRNPLTKLPLQISLTFDGRIAIKEEVYQIIGAALEVYYTLGQGFLEPVYQQALEIELTRRRIPFKAQDPLNIEYKGEELDKLYKPDFLCFGQIIVELKATVGLTGRDVGQLLNYMKATTTRVGLLINFGSVGRLEWKRYVI